MPVVVGEVEEEELSDKLNLRQNIGKEKEFYTSAAFHIYVGIQPK